MAWMNPASTMSRTVPSLISIVSIGADRRAPRSARHLHLGFRDEVTVAPIASIRGTSSDFCASSHGPPWCPPAD
jgi:hypothetical protein